MAYYFAFGSCMDLEDIARTVDAKVVGPARLDHHRLAFTKFSKGRNGGVADFIEAPDDYLEGMVFEVDDFTGLDAREGAPFFYQRVRVPVYLYKEDRTIFVSTYTIVRKEKGYEVQPTEEYAGLIRSGAKQLSPEYQQYLEEILRERRKRFVLRPKKQVRRPIVNIQIGDESYLGDEQENFLVSNWARKQFNN